MTTLNEVSFINEELFSLDFVEHVANVQNL